MAYFNPTEYLVILYVILATIQSIRFKGRIVANLIRSIALVILGVMLIGIAGASVDNPNYTLEGIGELLFLVAYLLLFVEVKRFRKDEPRVAPTKEEDEKSP